MTASQTSNAINEEEYMPASRRRSGDSLTAA